MTFKLNIYDLCTANAITKGKRFTICQYDRNNILSHADPNIVSEVIKQIEKNWKKDDEPWKKHEILCMDILLNYNKTVQIGMKKQIKQATYLFKENTIKSVTMTSLHFL